MMAQRLDQLSLLNHSGTRAHLTEAFSCPNDDELKIQTVYFLCISDLQETYGSNSSKGDLPFISSSSHPERQIHAI